MFKSKSVLSLAICAALAAGVDAAPAFAHARLVAADPAAGSMAMPAPKELKLTFSEGLEIAFSGVKLLGPDKKAVATGAARLDPKNDKVMIVPLKTDLPDGTYTVDWRALSEDGHKTHGSYSFDAMK